MVAHKHGTTSTSAIERSRQVRLRILELSYEAGRGHIGSALSVVEILLGAMGQVRGLGTEHPGRDRLVLSKGHAAVALYASLEQFGVLSSADLDNYCRDGSLLATHPMCEVSGIDFSTGSLGQGVTFAVGAALAGRVAQDDRRVYCLLSDAELNEGSTWECALIAAHQRLDNLVFILDYNGQQALGSTDAVLSLKGVPKAWQALGWNVVEFDGHDDACISDVLESTRTQAGPHLLVARTTSGKGVPFMERRIEWHYLPMSALQNEQAVHAVAERNST